MTRIALIAGTYQPDRCGVAHYTARLRQSLDEHALESIVLTTHNAAEAACDRTIIGAVHNWHFTDLLPLVQTIHATQADILHIQHAAGTYGFDRAIFLLPLLLRITGWHAPIVTTIHEYGWWEWQPKLIPPSVMEWLKTFGQQRRWWDREDGFLLTQSDAIITTNQDAEQVIHSRLPHLKAPVHRIPIGANIEVAPIDRASAQQQLRQHCNWSDDTVIIAFFGFLHPVKGLETLLPAFKQVLTAHPQARLLLVGGVESLALRDEAAKHYWNQLEDLITALGLTATVHMTGYLDAASASRCLSGADIGVLPFNHGVTLKSGSLLALLAHQLPVVATRSHPPDPTLSQQSFLRTIEPRDQDALTAELTKLMTNPFLRLELGTAGYRFSRQFTWSSIAAAHLEVYQNVLTHSSIQASRSTA